MNEKSKVITMIEYINNSSLTEDEKNEMLLRIIEFYYAMKDEVD